MPRAYVGLAAVLLLILVLAAVSRADAPPAAIRDLVNQLGSKDPVVVGKAACQLGDMGPAAAPAVPALLTIIRDNRTLSSIMNVFRPHHSRLDTNTSPGREACIALAKIGDKRAVQPLCTMMLERPRNKGEDPHWLERREAAWALGDLGDGAAVEPLLNAYFNDYFLPEAAEESIIALGAAAVDPLAKIVTGGSDAYRAKAFYFLGEIGQPSVKALTDLLNRDNPKFATPAATALANTSDPAALLALIDVYEGKRTSMRPVAFEGIALFCVDRERGHRFRDNKNRDDLKPNDAVVVMLLQDKVVDAAVATLSDVKQKPPARLEAATILRHARDPRGVGPLVNALKDKDEKLRQEACNAFFRFMLGADSSKEPYGEVDPAHKDRWAKNRADLTAEIKAKAVGALVECMRDKMLASSAEYTLKYLSHKSFKTYPEWKAWWDANAAEFQPKADTPAP